jgi:hypothetical protein
LTEARKLQGGKYASWAERQWRILLAEAEGVGVAERRRRGWEREQGWRG